MQKDGVAVLFCVEKPSVTMVWAASLPRYAPSERDIRAYRAGDMSPSATRYVHAEGANEKESDPAAVTPTLLAIYCYQR